MNTLYKYFSFLVIAAVFFTSFFGRVTDVTSESLSLSLEVKEAKAEALCPPPQTESHLIIREGSSSGALLGRYDADTGDYYVSDSLSVPNGTVLWVYAYTTNVETVNRSAGSRQTSTLPGTVTTPSADNTPNAGGYKPSGYSYTKQSSLEFTSDALSGSGTISVSGSNTCIPDPDNPETADEVGASAVSLNIIVGDAPDFTFVCDATKTVTRGQTATFALSATAINGYNENIDVTMASSPVGPALTTSPVVLNTGNSYLGSGQIATSGLSAGSYSLTFTADDGSTQKTCPASLVVEMVNPTVDLQFDGADGPTQPTPTEGDSGTLTWDTTNASVCTGSMEQGDDPNGKNPWTGPQSEANSGTQSFAVSGMQQDTTYEFGIICEDEFGNLSAPDTVVVAVGTAQPPVTDIKCAASSEETLGDFCTIDYGHAAYLSWSSSYADSCSIDQGVGTVTPSGTGYTTSLTSSRTYTITCSGPGGGPVSDSVTVSVNAANSYFTIECSPYYAVIQQTQSVGYIVTATAHNGYNSNVTLSMNSSSNGGGTLNPPVFD